jgi:hypothetical protein
VRLNGKQQKELNRECHERDGYRCIVCSKFVPEEVKMHHVRHGSSKEDVIENVVTLCYGCHQQVHGHNGQVIDQFSKWYLQKTYCRSIDSDHCTECLNELCEGVRR